jgi:hypothetical protein
MEIKNNKEEISFEHYLIQYQALDPQEASKRCFIPYDPETGLFSFRMMGREMTLSFPDCTLTAPDLGPKELMPAKILMVRYLTEGKFVPYSGEFKAYRDMPWGDVYSANFHGRCILRLAFSFGTNPQGFARAMKQCSAVPSDMGDWSYTVEFLSGLFLKFIIWEGDEEFPPSSQIMFSDNFPAAFTAEDMAVVGDISIGMLKRLSKV